MSINTQVAGSCLFNAILAVILVVVGGKVAYSHAFWSAAAYISLWIVPEVRSTVFRIIIRTRVINCTDLQILCVFGRSVAGTTAFCP